MIQGGFLIVDKPPGITSHDVVATVRAVTGIKKVGHTGTLDPFATGVLPLAIGRCTRLIQFLDEGTKVYTATVALGARTDTADPTGEVIEEGPVPALEASRVAEVLAGFVGERMQRPPAYSAVKVKGKRLYKYAREGQTVEAKARSIRIYSAELTSIGPGSLDVEIACSRGTYVRVLAEEIAQELGTVGHLSSLRRSRSGPFEIDDSLSFPALSQIVAGREDWPRVLRPKRGEERVAWIPREEVFAKLQESLCGPARALGHLPVVELTLAQRDLLQRKGAVPSAPAGVDAGGHFVALHDSELIAVLRREESGNRVARMFALASTPHQQS